MDSLTVFGLFSVSAMLLFYALEDRSPWYVLAFAGLTQLLHLTVEVHPCEPERRPA